MSKFFILALLFVSTMCVCARAQENPSTQETLTLNQAVAEAKYNSRLIKISQQSIVSANDQILASRTQRLPHFNVQMTAGSLLTAVGIAFNRGVFGNINNTPNPPDNVVVTTSPKFSGFGSWRPINRCRNSTTFISNIQALEVGKRLVEEQTRQQRRQVVNFVKDTYYSLSCAALRKPHASATTGDRMVSK